jgi:hypothetical protein
MDFIKKNWEKVLLGVVLVGLAVAVAFLPLKIASEKQKLDDVRQTILNPQVTPLPPADLSAAKTSLQRSEKPMTLDFSRDHRLFNPVLWQKGLDGAKIKVQSGREVGPDAIVIVKTTPLYLAVSLDNVITNEPGPRYAIGVERQAAEKAMDRRKRLVYLSVGEKSDLFTLTGTKGSSVVIEFKDSGESVEISKDKPFKRVDGYLADLKYPPETRSWLNKRVNDKLVFAGEDYNIVAINETEVVLSSVRTGKKTAVRMGLVP